MGVSRVDYNGETLIDLTGDSVAPETLAEGATAHAANGDPITGAMTAVQYGKAQALTDAQKAQARQNIGSASVDDLENALTDAKESGEFDGPKGPRGTGILPTTTGIAAYTTAVGGVKPAYRILLSTLKTQSKVSEVLIGDQVRYSFYLYPVIYVDETYAYLSTRVTIRGEAGPAGNDANVTAENIKNALGYTPADAASAGKFVARPDPPEDTSVFWIDTDDDSDDGFQEAVNAALAQAKASGEFDGKTPVAGKDYFTAEDKTAIVNQVIAALPVYAGEVV